MKTQNEHWRKKATKKVTLETKLLIIDQIQNGKISVNYANAFIAFWMEKVEKINI